MKIFLTLLLFVVTYLSAPTFSIQKSYAQSQDRLDSARSSINLYYEELAEKKAKRDSYSFEIEEDEKDDINYKADRSTTLKQPKQQRLNRHGKGQLKSSADVLKNLLSPAKK